MSKSFNKATDEEKAEVQKIIEQINVDVNRLVRKIDPIYGCHVPRYDAVIGLCFIDMTLIKKYPTFFQNYYRRFGWKLVLEPITLNNQRCDFQLLEMGFPRIKNIPKILIKWSDKPYYSHHAHIRQEYGREYSEVFKIFQQIQEDRIRSTWSIIEEFDKIKLFKKILDSENYSISFNYRLNLDGKCSNQEIMFIFAQWMAEEFDEKGWRLEAKIPGPNTLKDYDLIEFKVFPIHNQPNPTYKFVDDILNWPDYHEKILNEAYFQHVLLFKQAFLAHHGDNDQIHSARELTIPKNLKDRLKKEFRKLKQKIYFSKNPNNPNLLDVTL